MGTMNFFIPDDVKEAFNKAFEGENKSAVITRLMIRAIEEEERTRRSRDLPWLDSVPDPRLERAGNDRPGSVVRLLPHDQ